MKLAIVEIPNNYRYERVRIFVEDTALIGQYAKVNGCHYRILGFENQECEPAKPEPITGEYVQARFLEAGDVIFNGPDGWCTVESTYLNSRSPYAKLSVIPEKDAERYRKEHISGLSIKKDISASVLRKTRKHVMSTNLIISNDLVKEMQAKLGDLSALENAPSRIEAVPSVFIDKEPVVAAIKSELRAMYSKLGESLKRL